MLIMAEELAIQVHAAATIFSCITTNLRILVGNQGIHLATLNNALTHIQVLESEATIA